jgi:hypothetical protein
VLRLLAAFEAHDSNDSTGEHTGTDGCGSADMQGKTKRNRDTGAIARRERVSARG